MTTRIQLALLTQSGLASIAIINAVNGIVIDLLQHGLPPVELQLTPGVYPIPVDLPPDGPTVTVGQLLPDELLPAALRAILMPGVMATAEFAPASGGSSMLLQDISTVFKFNHGDEVRLGTSSVSGKVEGRSDYKSGERRYFVRYNNKDGLPSEDWYEESSLSHID